MRRTVVLGLLGSKLDRSAKRKDRWSQWRPTVSLCQMEDLEVHRYELLHQRDHSRLAQTVSRDLRTASPVTEVKLHAIDVADAWDFEEVYACLHEFARGYPFLPEQEDYLVHITTGTHVVQICEFLLTESRHFPARLLQTSPPKSKEQLPGSYSIIDLDLSKYDRLASRFNAEHQNDRELLKGGILTKNEAFNTLIERIERVGLASTSPIHLTGPTGAGKSQLARRIFELKKQRQSIPGNFVPVNCATLRGDGAMSALFGHKKGAFTGAVTSREGLLRQANTGVLFLDEIGELGRDEQAMLLSAVEHGSFAPVGSDHEVKSEFQLITGTNRDLRQDVAQGRFREDLLARINLWTFALPGLRERPEDIEPNLEHELTRWLKKTGRRVTFNSEAREQFLNFSRSPTTQWLGNFRDFGAALERMITLSQGGRIDTKIVEEEVKRLSSSWQRPTATTPSDAGSDEAILTRHFGATAASQLDHFDRVQLAEVLRVCEAAPTLSAAGRVLFSESLRRKSSSNDADRLRKYLARFGLNWKRLTATAH